MTIDDDLKAINKDIGKAKTWGWKINRAKYWIIKLTNIYPDYIFKAELKPDLTVKIIYSLKEVY